jgi:hypothetical protein
MPRPISPAEAIFLALADLDPDERAAFLGSAADTIRGSKPKWTRCCRR